MKRFAILCFSLLLIAGCTKEEAIPSIGIENINFDGNKLTFDIISEHVTGIEYYVGLFSEPLGSFTAAEELPQQTVTVQEILPDEKYIVMARAFAGDEVIEASEIFETMYSTKPFRKKILVSKFTGTWCGYCPQMSEFLENLEKEYPEEFVVTALHGGDDYETPYTSPLENKFFISGYPTAVIDYCYTSTQQPLMLRDSFDKTMSSNKAVCGIALDTGIEGDMLNITATVEAGMQANYRICVVLTEDDLHNDQTIGSLNGDGIYHDVVRSFLTDVEGDEIGRMAANSSEELSFEKKLDPSWNRDNLNVVVYVLKQNKAGKYFVNNLNNCKAGENAEIELL